MEFRIFLHLGILLVVSSGIAANEVEQFGISDHTKNEATVARPHLVVVDVDCGQDDAWALVLLLWAQERGLLRILAVTTASGNTQMNNVLRNTCRTLQIAGASNIPVYHGGLNLKIETNRTCNWYGCDGFCDTRFSWEPNFRQVKPIYGPHVLTQLAAKYPGEITLICLAPLLNIAQAMQMDPKFTSNLRDIFILGGDYPVQPTNATVEFNFQSAANSANTVLTQAQCPITLHPIQPGLNIDFTPRWGLDAFKNSKKPPIQMLHKVDLNYYKINPNDKIWWKPDLFLACQFLNRQIATRSLSTCARVQVKGPRAGQLITYPCEKNNVLVITQYDNELLRQEVLKSALI